ncbi:hypothetical protein [Capybara microvirus Cap1_SP_145]|nr:hypothetical protein [Capybara microvirus Cap1_SP_145]
MKYLERDNKSIVTVTEYMSLAECIAYYERTNELPPIGETKGEYDDSITISEAEARTINVAKLYKFDDDRVSDMDISDMRNSSSESYILEASAEKSAEKSAEISVENISVEQVSPQATAEK